MTRDWWEKRVADFDLVTSELTIVEATAGDPVAAADRMKVLSVLPILRVTADIELLDIREEVPTLAQSLLDGAALPPKAQYDALHLAVAAVHGVEFLMTWNCRHLANGMLWRKMEDVCATAGYAVPTICTPFTLIGDAYDPGPDH